MPRPYHARNESQTVRRLLLRNLTQGAGELQRREHFGAATVKQFQIIGEVVGFVDVAADDEDRASQLSLQRGCHRGDAASPQTGGGDRPPFMHGLSEFCQCARSDKPPDRGGWCGSLHTVSIVGQRILNG